MDPSKLSLTGSGGTGGAGSHYPQHSSRPPAPPQQRHPQQQHQQHSAVAGPGPSSLAAQRANSSTGAGHPMSRPNAAAVRSPYPPPRPTQQPTAQGRHPNHGGDEGTGGRATMVGNDNGDDGDDDDEEDDEDEEDGEDGPATARSSGGGAAGRGRGGSTSGNDSSHRPSAQRGSSSGAAGQQPSSVRTSVNDGKGGSGINRVNRACTNCRRMKMRCVYATTTGKSGGGAGQPVVPCKRCQHTGQECVMEKPTKSTSGGAAGAASAAAGSNGSSSAGADSGGGGSSTGPGTLAGLATGRGAGAGIVVVDGVGDDRIRSLESQVSMIQSTLMELVSAVRSSTSGGGNSTASPASARAHPPSSGGHPSDPPMAHISPASSSHYSHPPQPLPQLGPGGAVFDPNQRVMDLIQGPRADMGSAFDNAAAAAAYGYRARAASAASGGIADEAAMSRYVQNSARGFGTSNTRSSASTGGFGLTAAMSPAIDFSALIAQSEAGSQHRSVSAAITSTTPGKGKRPRSNEISAIPSPAGSDAEDEDPLAPSQIMAPLGNMSSMAGLAEAAVERARAERLMGSNDGKVAADEGKEVVMASLQDMQSGSPHDAMSADGRNPKRPRLDDHGFAIPDQPLRPGKITSSAGLQDYPGASLLGTAPRPVSTDIVRTSKGKHTRRHVHAFPDVIALGLVSEQEARELFELYFSGSNNFMPVFDPEYDTWDALRIRSPFSISSIIAVGARVRDGGGPMSETQRLSLDHARRIAIGTVFAAVARVEAVQAMCLISAFNENGWLPSGHAVRMAIDMGLNKSFEKLVATGMGAGKSRYQLEEERDLVIGARVWFGLYVLEHQMSFGTGRDPVIRESETIANARKFLDHPLSIMSDVRLVSTVEGIALRAPLHFLLTSSPEEPVDQGVVARLQQADRDFDKWLEYWDKAMNDKFGKDPTDFYRESLRAQREYSSLFLNSQLLRGIRDAADVQKLPADKRELAIKAMRNAQACLDIVIRGKNYRRGLRFAVHYTHVCAAFAASFLIRIARLFPKDLDLRKTAKDVEELAAILSEVPAGRYARSLRLILRRARKQKFIPPASVPGSPNKQHAALPTSDRPSQQPYPAAGPTPNTAMLHHSLTGLSPVMSQTSPGMLINSALSQKHESPSSNPEHFEYDFSFAQELINRANEAGINLGQDQQQLPLFLNGESLGNADAANPTFSLENYFMPPDIDLRFGDLSSLNSTEALQNMPSWPSAPADLPPDMWW